MADLTSARPGIIDDTSDGDLGANVAEPQYGSLAEHEALDEAREADPDRGADDDADAGAGRDGDGRADRAGESAA